jgi:hypothetical protein
VRSANLRQAEDEGRRRGCRAGVLYTISFQAPGFYARHGWRVFGEIPCDPPGTSHVFMTKDLAKPITPSTPFTPATAARAYLSVLTIPIHLPISFDHLNRTIRA